MKINYNKKYMTVAIYSIIVFLICLLLLFAVFNFNGLINILSKLFHVLNPIIWGLVLAYLLNPIMLFFEKQFKKLIEKKKPYPKLCRYLAIMVTAILTLFVISSLIAIILPQIIESISSILNSLPNYFNNAEEWFDRLLENNPGIKQFFNEEFQNLQQYSYNFAEKMQPQLKNFIGILTAGVINLALGIKDFCLGFIVMIYLLASKEVFQTQTKKIMYAFLSPKAYKNIMSVWHKIDTSFIGFISGKVLNSFIIGMLCFIAMSLMDMPYVILISFIVGIMNLIPYFGPFIGAIPSGLLILLANPDKIVAFVVFIIILQQFDSNILGPKILGDSTGLPAFWVLFALFISGGLFGFVGMLIGVPIFAVIYMLLRQLIETKLKNKKDHFDVQSIDEKNIEKIIE